MSLFFKNIFIYKKAIRNSGGPSGDRPVAVVWYIQIKFTVKVMENNFGNILVERNCREEPSQMITFGKVSVKVC